MTTATRTIDRAAVAAMHDVGFHPAIIYACEATGMLLTEEQAAAVNPRQVDRWDDAIEDWELEYGQRVPSRRVSAAMLSRWLARSSAN